MLPEEDFNLLAAHQGGCAPSPHAAETTDQQS